MKIIVVISIAALVLFSACGSESSTESTSHPRLVDAWMPFVQVLPQQGIWEVWANEPETSSLSREDRIYYETQRIYAFFATTRGLFDRDVDFPDFFGGRYWYRIERNPRYLVVLIVDGREDEASEFLAYIEDFETTIIGSTSISYNEFLYVFEQIWNFGVNPLPFHSTWINIYGGYIRVTLLNYSDEEVGFFREHISDSPLIVFKCAYEAYGEVFMARFWAGQPQLLNELDGFAISVRIENATDSRGNRIQNAFVFMFSVYNNSEFSYQVMYSYLSVYRNARWVYLRTNTNLINTELAPGYNLSSFPRRISRQHSGPFKITFILRQADEQEILHRLEHVFRWVE